MTKITVKDLWKKDIVVPAKPACEFQAGDIIQQDYGYTLKVEKVMSEDDGEITFEVEHVPEESEFYDWKPIHVRSYKKNELLGIATRHGNEGLC